MTPRVYHLNYARPVGRRARSSGRPYLPPMHSGGFNPVTVYAVLVLFVAATIVVVLLMRAARDFLADAVGPAWVPLTAIVLLAVGALAAWSDRRRVARSHREAVGRCPACGYDLRATAARCPECGNPIPADLERRRRLAVPLPAAGRAALRRRLIEGAGRET